MGVSVRGTIDGCGMVIGIGMFVGMKEGTKYGRVVMVGALVTTVGDVDDDVRGTVEVGVIGVGVGSAVEAGKVGNDVGSNV